MAVVSYAGQCPLLHIKFWGHLSVPMKWQCDGHTLLYLHVFCIKRSCILLITSVAKELVGQISLFQIKGVWEMLQVFLV